MRTENQVFLPNILCPQYRKNSWWPLLSFRLFGISKTFCHIMIFRQIFWSHSTETLREEPPNISESFKCQVSKKFMQLNGMSRFSVENFSSQGAERFRCGTLRYIRKVRPSKNFMTKRLITFFSVEFFFTYTSSKVRWRTPLCFRIFGTSKIFMLSRGQRNFPSVFWPPSTEKPRG